MIAIDTNILVRYIVGDDAPQAELARHWIETQCNPEMPARIPLIVLCELVWVLGGAYHYERHLVGRVLRQVLVTDCFDIQNHSLAWIALSDYVNGQADFADCLIARLNQAYGCSTTYTFDRKASRLSGFTLLTENC